jgi:prepilin peptidase CpaA
MAVLALGCVIAAAAFDLWRYEIPDVLSIGLLVTALAYGILTPGFDWPSHLAAPPLMFGIGLALFHFGWFGGGDVKLLIGLAGWCGLGGFVPLAGLPLLLAMVSFTGAGLAAALLIGRRLAGGVDPERLPRMLRRGGPVPYAVAIAAGTVWWAAQVYPA